MLSKRKQHRCFPLTTSDGIIDHSLRSEVSKSSFKDCCFPQTMETTSAMLSMLEVPQCRKKALGWWPLKQWPVRPGPWQNLRVHPKQKQIHFTPQLPSSFHKYNPHILSPSMHCFGNLCCHLHSPSPCLQTFAPLPSSPVISALSFPMLPWFLHL